MEDRLRILYFSWTLPTRGSGANLAMYRHFIQNRDFDIHVISNQPYENREIPFFQLPESPILNRLGSTRLSRLIQQIKMIYWSRRLPDQVHKIVQSFQPQAIFTIPDHNISWAAWRLARKTGLPLITNFQDWWPRGQFYYGMEQPYPPVRALLERRMRRMYRDSALVFCTSEGFLEYLGPHANAHVLYPISEKEELSKPPPSNWTLESGRPFRILYTGTPFGSYGRLLLELIRALEVVPEVEVIVYGAEPDWDSTTKEELRRKGTYRGFLPFEKLKAELATADAFLAIMSFDRELEVMMRTSFTTKVLDYCRSARPVIVWGPDYCQPVKVIRENAAGTIHTGPEVNGLIPRIRDLMKSEIDRVEMAAAAWRLSQTLFKHENIHNILRSSIHNLLQVEQYSHRREDP